jgi:hypothetical protein
MMPVQKCRGRWEANLSKSQSSARFGQYGCGRKERLKLLYEKIARRCVKLEGGNFNVRKRIRSHRAGRITVRVTVRVEPL